MSVDQPDGDSEPSIPDRSWENPFTPGTWLHEHFEEIVSEERGLIIILDDLYGRRGTGKTVASLQLANGMDQTLEGVTWSKATMRPEAVRNAYSAEPIRSGLVLDEGEVGASNRDPMSKTNKALREIMSMGRIKQKYVIINTPLKQFIDIDLRKLADVWISMVRRGLALVHHFKWESYSETLQTPKKQWIEFEDIPRGTQLRSVYNKLTEAKDKKINGGDDGGFVPAEEHRDELRKAKKQARQERRNEIIHDIARDPAFQESDYLQSEMAQALGLSPTRVSQIVNSG
jgi:hypothetical protein